MAELDIPDFLNRIQQEKPAHEETQATDETTSDRENSLPLRLPEVPEETAEPGATDLPKEPTLEDILSDIRRLRIKADKIGELIIDLKKKAESMLHKL